MEDEKVTQQQVALLELVLVSGLGAILFIAGMVISIFTDRRNKSCTSETVGEVVGHSFRGGGRMAPVAEFEVGGKPYTCQKRFNGVIAVRATNLDEPKAWEGERGYLHVKTGVLANMRQVARELWPIGSKMAVHYDPRNPEVNYADRPVSNAALSIVFLCAGAGMVALGMLVYYLMLHA